MGSAARLPAFDETAVMAALADVPDPEIPAVTLIDLGIIRGLQADPPALLVTPTYTGCPATLVIEQMVRAALDRAGFADLPIRTILSPAWTTDWITEKGRGDLLAYGIAPPPRGAPSRSLRGGDIVECPQCGSSDTTEVSRFGSTPCKAQWRCKACLEPFDRFKCH